MTDRDTGAPWPQPARVAADRREFLKAAGLAALPLALRTGLAAAQDTAAPSSAPTSSTPPPQPSVTRPSPVAGSDRIKIGLIGCGGRGTGAAVQALRADPGLTLHALGDVFSERLDSALAGITAGLQESNLDPSARVDVPAERRFLGFDAGQRVIESGVDAVLLCEYPQFRPRHIEAAIAAGKHVFAEKPIAVDAPGVRRVLAAAQAAHSGNLALGVGFCWRHHQGMKATFAQINSGAIGPVHTVHTTYHTSTLGRRPRRAEWSDVEFQMRNWWHFTWISGDHIVEQAVHSIDRLSWAFKDELPLRVTCLGGRAARSGPEHGNAYDHFAAVYEYPGGRRGFHTTRQIDQCPSDNSDYVFAAGGQAEINGWKPVFRLSPPDGDTRGTWKYRGPITDMYQNEHDALWASIRAGAPLNDGVRGAHSTLLAVMARMAAYTGQTITWDQALNSTEDLTPADLKFGPLATPPIAIPGQTKFV